MKLKTNKEINHLNGSSLNKRILNSVKKVKFVIANSNFTKNLAIKIGITENKIHIIHPGCDEPIEIDEKFEIQAKEGLTDARNYENIFLTKVMAKINLKDSDVIIITADSADYNKSTVETFFRNNVQVNYINHKVESDKLHLSFQDKIASINENVVYMGNNTKMITDNIEIDFRDKNTKIFMNSNEEKVFVKTVY